jgi:hypothetical protein
MINHQCEKKGDAEKKTKPCVPSQGLFGCSGQNTQGMKPPTQISPTTKEPLHEMGKIHHSAQPFGYVRQGNGKERTGNYKIRKWVIIWYKLVRFFNKICCQFQENK